MVGVLGTGTRPQPRLDEAGLRWRPAELRNEGEGAIVNVGSIVGETGEYGESVTVTGICRICENAKMRKSGEDMG